MSAAIITLELAPAEPATGSVELIAADSLMPVPIDWLWPKWLARGKLHVLAGAPGTGKTTLAMAIAACVSAGLTLPSGYRPRQGSVIIWSGEDDPADTLVPRLIAAGADLSRVRFVGEVVEAGQRYTFDPARDVDKLAAACVGVDVALLIVDPLVSAVSGDSHKNAEVRRGLAPLADLAASLNAALLGITHYSKGTQGRDPLERVSGSVAFGALPRIVWGTVRQRDEGKDDTVPRRMLLAVAKSNIGPDGGGFTYAFEQVDLPEEADIEASRIVWGAAVEGTARELLTEAELQGDRCEARDAANWLRSLLASGSMTAKDIYREAESAGYSSDAMKRAKRRVGVEAIKAGMTGGWCWRLPDVEGSAKGAKGAPLGNQLPSRPSGADPLPSSDWEDCQ